MRWEAADTISVMVIIAATGYVDKSLYSHENLRL
jgi:hypothetical protein